MNPIKIPFRAGCSKEEFLRIGAELFRKHLACVEFDEEDELKPSFQEDPTTMMKMEE